MKIQCIADTHTFHKQVIIEDDVDILLVAGDFAATKGVFTNLRETWSFLNWIDELPVPYKIFIAGNHDTAVEARVINPKEVCKSAFYLEHESININGLKIWGSPYQIEFCNWAFNVPEPRIAQYWVDIPDNADIVITHGPCYGILDKCSHDGYRAGDRRLLERIKAIKPKIHVCGHIHENTGIVEHNGTKFINAAVVDDRYRVTNNGIIIEL